MKRCTDNAREPTEKERAIIDVGLIAVRQLAESDGESYELSEKLMELNNYFEDWPCDEEAARGEYEDNDENCFQQKWDTPRDTTLAHLRPSSRTRNSSPRP